MKVLVILYIGLHESTRYSVYRSSCKVPVILYIGLHVKYPFFLSYSNETSIFSQDFRKKTYSNMKFHENPTSESRVFPCGRTERQTSMTKLKVLFHNFRNASKNLHFFNSHFIIVSYNILTIKSDSFCSWFFFLIQT